MNTVYEGIIESLKELKAYGNGEPTGVVIHRYDEDLKPPKNKPKRNIVILAGKNGCSSARIPLLENWSKGKNPPGRFYCLV